MNTPIALFVYDRPRHTRQTVEALKKNSLAPESHLFIFSDAPKNSQSDAAVVEVRDYLLTITGFKTVTIIERKTNFGLANSIIDGVTHLCNDFERVIVLEDDLITSPYFLKYMNAALERYEFNSQVMQISGHMFPVEIISEEDAFFLPFVTSWGWATWKRAWAYLDPTAAGYRLLKQNKKKRRAFDLDGAYPYFEMLESQLRGEIDSWAIRWNLSVFLNNGLVLYPKITLINNAGFDGSGTHCVESTVSQMAFQDMDIQTLPSEVVVLPENRDAVYQHLFNCRGNRLKRLIIYLRVRLLMALDKCS